MKAILIGAGSRGDVRPMLSLGIALAQRGSEVVVMAAPQFQSWIESFSRYGITFRPMGKGIFDLMQPEYLRGYSKIALVQILKKFAEEEILGQIAAYSDPFIQDATIIIGGVFCFVGESFAEFKGIPYVRFVIHPSTLRSAHSPSPLFGVNWRFPKIVNKLSWRITDEMAERAISKPLNQFRRYHGLLPLKSPCVMGQSALNLAGFDHEVLKIPEDVYEQSRVVNKPILEMIKLGSFPWPLEDELDLDLLPFMKDGTPPILLSIGTVGDKQRQDIIKLVGGSVADLGLRAIILQGGSPEGVGNLPSTVRIIQDVPYSNSKLLPLARAFVHHGGSGTTGDVLRFGIPHIVIPHVQDQFFTAKDLYSAGLSSPPIPIKQLTQNRLTTALQMVLENNLIQQKAKEVGKLLAKKNPLVDAVNFLERCVSHR
ncbi:MAG: glycosyltransferase family 1 protein [Oligoflexia bacterium]|nr:glycosyltransferase family 1 protein [Oligoflexia bacterium]